MASSIVANGMPLTGALLPPSQQGYQFSSTKVRSSSERKWKAGRRTGSWLEDGLEPVEGDDDDGVGLPEEGRVLRKLVHLADGISEAPVVRHHPGDLERAQG